MATISVLTAADCEIDLILSDVQMPGSVDGFALARWVRQNRPGLEIILTSGYAGAAQESKELCNEKDIVAKPYEFERLLDQIKQSLARRNRNV